LGEWSLEEQEMARFSFRPALTLKGRKFFGLRGFAGKPFHPPLTDIPIGAYVFAATFDLISWVGHYTQVEKGRRCHRGHVRRTRCAFV
jgi:hypothetical protein